ADQGPALGRERRPARAPAPAEGGPLAADQGPVPPQERLGAGGAHGPEGPGHAPAPGGGGGPGAPPAGRGRDAAAAEPGPPGDGRGARYRARSRRGPGGPRRR